MCLKISNMFQAFGVIILFSIVVLHTSEKLTLVSAGHRDARRKYVKSFPTSVPSSGAAAGAPAAKNVFAPPSLPQVSAAQNPSLGVGHAHEAPAESPPRLHIPDLDLVPAAQAAPSSQNAVSYTHLTLPTIYSV